MTKPIRPEDLPAAKAAQIPDFVFDAVNGLLAKHAGSGSRITLRQPEVISAILARVPGLWENREEALDSLFANRWLDFESAYQDAGWEVAYDKPGYNESYDAFWVFRPKGESSHTRGFMV